jgi:hypothetical protein
MNSGTGRVGRLDRRFLLAYTSYTEDVKWPTVGKFQTTPCRCATLRQASTLMRLLNPVAAKIATTPATSDYTSITQRMEHVEAQVRTAGLEAAEDGSVVGSRAAGGLEEALWLCQIEDRRGLDSAREGMMQGFPLGSYVKLVDYTGRLFRQGKASISAELAMIFVRLGCSAQSRQARQQKLKGDRLLGRFFATTRAKLREISESLGLRHVVNLVGCPAR